MLFSMFSRAFFIILCAARRLPARYDSESCERATMRRTCFFIGKTRDASRCDESAKGFLNMPIYEYQCEGCEHEFETIQKMSEAPLTQCPSCGKDLLKQENLRGCVSFERRRLVRDRLQIGRQEECREQQRFRRRIELRAAPLGRRTPRARPSRAASSSSDESSMTATETTSKRVRRVRRSPRAKIPARRQKKGVEERIAEARSKSESKTGRRWRQVVEELTRADRFAQRIHWPSARRVAATCDRLPPRATSPLGHFPCAVTTVAISTHRMSIATSKSVVGSHRRRDHGGVIFLDVRDRSGIVQVVYDPDIEDSFATADKVRNEYVLRITGRVRRRPDGTRESRYEDR